MQGQEPPPGPLAEHPATAVPTRERLTRMARAQCVQTTSRACVRLGWLPNELLGRYVGGVIAVPRGTIRSSGTIIRAPATRARRHAPTGVSVRPGRTYPPPAPHGAGPELAELGARADSRCLGGVADRGQRPGATAEEHLPRHCASGDQRPVRAASVTRLPGSRPWAPRRP